MPGRMKSMARMAVVGAAAAVTTIAGVAWTAAHPVFNKPSAVFPAGDAVHGKALGGVLHGLPRRRRSHRRRSAVQPAEAALSAPSSIFYALQDYRAGRRRSDIMEPMAKDLSDQDMRDLAAYLSAGPNRRRGADPKGPAMAASAAHAKVGEVCGLCHGEAGLGVMDGYPALAGQHQSYLEHALLAYRSGERANPIMRHFAATLKPDEVSRMAEYFAAQPGLEPNR